MMQTRWIINLLCAACAVLLVGLTSCVTPLPSGSQVLLADSPAGKLELDLVPDSKGGLEFVMSGQALGQAIIHGFVRQDGELWKLVPVALDWFSNWTNGWTEARFVVDGELGLERGSDGASWQLKVEKTPLVDTPEQARIRWFDQYYDGEAALTRFSRRWERIRASADFLRQDLAGLSFAKALPQFRDAFKQILFPEVFGYPQGSAASTTVKRLGEGIWWDPGYSEARFPESLREIRNTGTMFRDFEECTRLWYLAYSWDELWQHALGNLVFQESKHN